MVTGVMSVMTVYIIKVELIIFKKIDLDFIATAKDIPKKRPKIKLLMVWLGEAIMWPERFCQLLKKPVFWRIGGVELSKFLVMAK